MRPVFRSLLGVFVVPVLMLSSVQAQERRSFLEWQTFVVQDFGTSIQYPATIFAPVGKAEKGLGQRFERADGRATLSIYELDRQGRPSQPSRRMVLRGG